MSEKQIVLDLIGGADADRTRDLLNAIQALSQLSYSPSLGTPARPETAKRQEILREPGVNPSICRVGGSGWTRTIDPALIKRVL